MIEEPKFPKNISTKDLRIGNYVRLCFEHKEGWTNAKVTDIYNDGTIDTDCDEIIEGKKYYFEGIFLTEDILIKSGFEPNGIYASYRKPLNEISSHTRAFLVVALNPAEYWIDLIHKKPMDGFTELQGPSIKLPSVHQLQNLYFALTGGELTINNL